MKGYYMMSAIRVFFYSILIAALVMSWYMANATTITIINKLEGPARIAHFRNKCQNDLIPEAAPRRLSPGESVTLTKVAEVVQTYTVCAYGFCSASAMGTHKGEAKYEVHIVMEGRYPNLSPKPDHWSTTNLECPK